MTSSIFGPSFTEQKEVIVENEHFGTIQDILRTGPVNHGPWLTLNESGKNLWFLRNDFQRRDSTISLDTIFLILSSSLRVRHSPQTGKIPQNAFFLNGYQFFIFIEKLRIDALLLAS